MKSKTFKVFKLQFSILFFVVLTILATYVLTIRIGSAMLQDRLTSVEIELTETLGKTVEIGSIENSWQGFDPIFDINGIGFNGRHNAYVGRTRIQFSFLKSLFTFSPVIERVVLEHAELNLLQNSDGSWLVAGLDSAFLSGDSAKETDEYDNSLLIDLLGKTQIQIRDLLVSLHNNDGHVSSLRVPESALAYQQDKVFLSGSLQEKGSQQTLLNFTVEGTGELGVEPIRSQVYIEARSSKFLSHLLNVYRWENIALDNIDGNARLWLDIDGLSLRSVQGSLQVSDLNWRSGKKSLPPLNNMALNFNYTEGASQKEISLYGLNYQFGDAQCANTDLKLMLGAENINVIASQLDVECASSIAVATGLISDSLGDRLEVSHPRGLLKNISLDIVTNDQADFHLEAELENVSLDAFESTPSGFGIDGYVAANSSGGYVSFDSERFQLGFPTLFLDPWDMSKSEGLVAWLIEENGDVEVKSEGLRLWFDDGSLVYGDFILWLNDENHEDYLELSIGMQDIPFQKVTNFVPYYEVGEGLHSWLAQSLQSGNVRSGIYMGYGSVEEVTAENSYTSSILVNTQNGVLQYEEAWPPLTQLNAEIDLQNNQLVVEADSALVANTSLQDIKASLPEETEGIESLLSVTSHTSLSQDKVKYWLESSPIAPQTAEISQQISIQGDLGVNIQLDIPVSEGGAELKYNISSSLNGNTIEHLDSGIVFSEVNGGIEVSSERGVFSEHLDLVAFGQDASLSIHTEYDERTESQFVDFTHDDFEDLNRTVFKLRGSTKVEDVFRFFGYQDTAFIDGGFEYEADLYLPNHQQSYPYVNVRSDLIGVARNWPSPIFKPVHEKEDLALKLLIKPNQLFLGANIDAYNKTNISTELLFVNQEFSFGELAINGAQMELPELNGLNIAANIERVDISAWVDFVDKLTEIDWSSQEKLAVTQSGEESTSTGGEIDAVIESTIESPFANESENALDDPSIIKRLELSAAAAHYDDFIFDSLRSNIYPENSSWIIDLDAPSVKGKISLPDAGQSNVLSMDFDVLKLDKEERSDTQEDNAISVANVPAFDFTARELSFNGKNLGAISFSARTEGNQAEFNQINWNVRGSQISADLTWKEIEPGTHLSILTANVNGNDFEKMFNLIDVDPLFSSDRYASEIGVTWPSHPADFSLAKLSGKFVLNAKDGFLNTDDKDTGILRLFGVLNAEAITRRLKLDFSDLYKSGVGFDSFSFNSSIDQGLLRLVNPLVIEGPAGDYTINGNSDLAAETLDLDMLVELPFSQNVPLAALALGAPQIGGLVWVADKLLGEPLSALTTSRYDISGSWSEPVVELKEAVNAKKKKRNEEIIRHTPKEAKENDDVVKPTSSTVDVLEKKPTEEALINRLDKLEERASQATPNKPVN